MSPTRRLARPLLASMFISSGIETLRRPGPQVEAVRAAGLSSPEQLVKANGAANLAGGLMLATNRLPRLSSLVLASNLVPSTYLNHAFWQEKDKEARKEQQAQFLQDLALLGGLLLAVVDTGGRESLPHAAGRVSRKAAKKVAKAQKSASKSLPRVA